MLSISSSLSRSPLTCKKTLLMHVCVCSAKSWGKKRPRKERKGLSNFLSFFLGVSSNRVIVAERRERRERERKREGETSGSHQPRWVAPAAPWSTCRRWPAPSRRPTSPSRKRYGTFSQRRVWGVGQIVAPPRRAVYVRFTPKGGGDGGRRRRHRRRRRRRRRRHEPVQHGDAGQDPVAEEGGPHQIV